MDEKEARAIAADWHGGQANALYAFASSGYISEDNLEWEIRRELKMPHLSGKAELRALLAYVEEQKSKRGKTITLTAEEADFVSDVLFAWGEDNNTTDVEDKIIDDVLEKISHG